MHKIYGVYSPSHEKLLRDWFLPTMQDDFEVNFRKTDQLCPLGRFMSVGWVRAVSAKIDFLLAALGCASEGEWIIFSDVDIQWFRSAKAYLEEAACLEGGENDMMFQEDAAGEFCTGFFVCRANERTRGFWGDVAKLMRDKISGDQRAANYLLASGSHAVRASHLPRVFWGPGQGRQEKTFWRPGSPLNVPSDIVLHHANWAAGVESKIEQLRYVRSLMESKKT